MLAPMCMLAPYTRKLEIVDGIGRFSGTGSFLRARCSYGVTSSRRSVVRDLTIEMCGCVRQEGCYE